MRCAHHPLREAAGYCSVCGEFGCSECLGEFEGATYCPRHFKPLADKAKRQEEQKSRPERQRLVVHTLKGQTFCGICYAMNPQKEEFTLDLMDRDGANLGKSQQFRFSDLKAVFYVKSFTGIFDPSQAFREWHPEGNEVVILFADGEILRGATMHPYRSGEPRFYVVPADPESNNISILVEGSAVKEVLTPEEFAKRQHEEWLEYKRAHHHPEYDEAEILGDYYFDKHDYIRAMQRYRAALHHDKQNERVKRKIVTAQYNVAMRNLKRHDYRRALEALDAVLKLDPLHDRAAQKAERIREHIARHKDAKSIPRMDEN